MPTRVVLVRHAQSEFNARHLIQGQLDPPLDDVGLEQLRVGAPRAASEHSDASRVYTSDLSRASTTARAIADALNVDVIADVRLRERHLGNLQGLPRAELKDAEPSAYAAWKSRDPNQTIPGGGECGREVDERLCDFFREIFRELARDGPQKVIAVTHGGVLGRVFSGGRNGDEKRLCGMRRGVGNLAECVVDVDIDGSWRCEYATWASGRFLESTALDADDVA